MPTAPDTTLDRVADDPVDEHDVVRAAVVDELLRARAAEHAAQLQQLWMALQWAHLHPAEVDEDGVVGEYAGWGDPGLLATDASRVLVPLAGPGAPLVSPLAPPELGAALDRSHDHARQLLGDVLELAHRLPRLWALTQQARVPVWLARRISRETRDLTHDAALHADRLVTAVPERVAQVDAARLVHEARLHADPDRAQADEEAALARRGVWLRRDGRAPGVTDVHMTLDTDDAELLDATLDRVAADLHGLGDTAPHDVRRATAVGILADPQHALDLMSGRRHDDESRCGRGDVDLVVHLTPSDLASATGVAVEETRGAVSTGQLTAWVRRRAASGGRVRVREVLHGGHGPCATFSTTDDIAAWLARHDLTLPATTLRPVDLAADPSVDAHDPPPTMREHVVFRDAHCVFPGCRRDSRTCDLDHVTPYESPEGGGPPGQTRPSNLAPLCRRHHNAKTHHAWTYQRARDGSYAWTSPTGHAYVVVPHSRALLAHDARTTPGPPRSHARPEPDRGPAAR